MSFLIPSQLLAKVPWNFNRLFKMKNSIIKRFIDDNKDIINQSDSDKRTLLCKAIQFKNDEIAKFLIRKGAGLEQVDECVSLPLMYAIAFNRLFIFRLLLKHGARARIDCEKGTTDLFYAIIGYTGDNAERLEIIKDLVGITIVDQKEFQAIERLYLKTRIKGLGLSEKAAFKEWKKFLKETGLKVNMSDVKNYEQGTKKNTKLKDRR